MQLIQEIIYIRDGEDALCVPLSPPVQTLSLQSYAQLVPSALNILDKGFLSLLLEDD